MEDKFYVRISPESITKEISSQIYEGITFGVYSGMSQFVNAETTDFNIPIILNQTYDDLGFYTAFDGFVLQKDIVNNFIFDGDEDNLYMVKVYNTAEQLKTFLKFATYQIDWGDGVVETFNEVFPNFKSHSYAPESASYVIRLTQTNPWGTLDVRKRVYFPFVDIVLPVTEASFTLPDGTVLIYDDSVSTIENQLSSNFTTTPITITGYSKSQLNELTQYGPNKFVVGKDVKKYGESYGIVNEITETYTAYTINNILYYDYPDGTTIYIVESEGFTEEMLDEEYITKEELMIGFVSSPEIQSDIFIDRGKYSGLESLLRLGEVDNIGDLTLYGYGYFKINKI
jgi:hypothetical protein